MRYRIVKPVAVASKAGVAHYRHPGVVVELTDEQAAECGARVEPVVEAVDEPRRPRRSRGAVSEGESAEAE